jgi:hypothetical protein
MLGLISLWLWLPIRDTSGFGKILKPLMPALIAASFYGSLALQAAHVHTDKSLFYALVVPELVAVAVVWLTYILNRKGKVASRTGIERP